MVTDTPVYVQAVKSGKQLSDVSNADSNKVMWTVMWTAIKTGPPLKQKWPFLTVRPESAP